MGWELNSPWQTVWVQEDTPVLTLFTQHSQSSWKTERSLHVFHEAHLQYKAADPASLCFHLRRCSNLTAIYKASFQPKVWTDRIHLYWILKAWCRRVCQAAAVIRYSGRVSICWYRCGSKTDWSVCPPLMSRRNRNPPFPFLSRPPFLNKAVSRWTEVFLPDVQNEIATAYDALNSAYCCVRKVVCEIAIIWQ